MTPTIFHRQAGQVKRWHTELTLREQTISDHVYNVMRIFYWVWGPPTQEQFIELITHDIEEREMGDWPHWIAARPIINEIKDNLEHAIRDAAGIPQTETSNAVKICDWIEAIEFMVQEYELGNHGLRTKMEGLWAKILILRDSGGIESIERVDRYLKNSGLKHRYNCAIDGV